MRALGVTAVGGFLLVLAEIIVFVLVARAIGWPLAVLAGLATMAVGAVLLQREGVRGWRRFRAAVAEGRPAGGEVTDGLTGLLGALLLLTPGFVTDAAGLLLLLPPVRAVARGQVRRFAERRISPAAAGDLFGPKVVRAADPGRPAREPGAGGEVVEGEVLEGDVIDPQHRHER